MNNAWNSGRRPLLQYYKAHVRSQQTLAWNTLAVIDFSYESIREWALRLPTSWRSRNDADNSRLQVTASDCKVSIFRLRKDCACVNTLRLIKVPKVRMGDRNLLSDMKGGILYSLPPCPACFWTPSLSNTFFSREWSQLECETGELVPRLKHVELYFHIGEVHSHRDIFTFTEDAYRMGSLTALLVAGLW
jgi:hypothetical protein